jgi:hypothetical protein
VSVIIFLSGATPTANKYRNKIGELIVPSAGQRPDSLALVPGRWAMDNGAFVEFDVAAYVRMLELFYRRPGCRFVTAPDRVGDAHATLQQWPFLSRLIRGLGFPPALVAQDGLTPQDVPWNELAAPFIGGHSEWKLGPQAQTLISLAHARGLWVHIGRVNTRHQIFDAARIGCDSFDGTGFSRWPDERIPKGLRWIEDAQQAHQDRLI